MLICVLAGLEVKLKNMLYPVIVAPTHIAELRAISHTDKGVKFGASVTLTRIDEELKDAIQKYPGIIDHNMSHPVIVAPTHIAELRAMSHTDKGVKFGASVTLTRIDEELKDVTQKYPVIYRSQYVPPSDCCPNSYS